MLGPSPKVEGKAEGITTHTVKSDMDPNNGVLIRMPLIHSPAELAKRTISTKVLN